MKEKLKWLAALAAVLMVLYGIQKMESILTDGAAKKQEADVIIDAGHGGSRMRNPAE